MSLMSKAIILGIVIGLSGLIFSLISFGYALEERLGLDLLFSLRGLRTPPPDTIIVSLNKASAEKLNLPTNPEKWPHSLHAQVVENLVDKGAKVIAFDIFFGESRSTRDESLFANEIDKAGNVVLVQSIQKDNIILDDEKGLPKSKLNIETLVSPIPVLSQSAAAMAPFPLPKVPVKVSQYWTFKTSAGDIPTLPITVFQLFALDVYEDFVRLIKTSSIFQIENLATSRNDLMKTKKLTDVMKEIRDLFKNDPMIAQKILREIEDSEIFSGEPEKRQLLKSLTMMYKSPDSIYLNFYGPTHTITTIPYYDVLQPKRKSNSNQKKIDFKNKVVFIGASEIYQPEQIDGYYTVFTKSSGVDIGGVEIAATAFANLLESMPVHPVNVKTQFIIIFLFGMSMGIICRFFSNIFSVVIMMGTSILYYFFIQHQFNVSGTWYPLVVPLFFQAPLALIGSISCKYFETNKERENIRKGFSYYLPDDVVDKIAKNISNIKTDSQIVHGICLSTDAEKYTAVCETMGPEELGSFMNKYYEAVFEPVTKHDGVVSNVIGDSMLAIWVKSHTDDYLGRKALIAALDIEKAVDRFNKYLISYGLKDTQLPTRIGIHSGDIFLGNIGGIDHYEYRPAGNIVNTASRIEGLNKYLGTQILVSHEVIRYLEGFLSRELGKFLMAGKSQPLVVHELICLTEEASKQQKDLCALFSEAMGAFKQQSWMEASAKFFNIINRYGEDGPTKFYLNLCEQFKEEHIAEPWDGVVCLDKK